MYIYIYIVIIAIHTIITIIMIIIVIIILLLLLIIIIIYEAGGSRERPGRQVPVAAVVPGHALRGQLHGLLLLIIIILLLISIILVVTVTLLMLRSYRHNVKNHGKDTFPVLVRPRHQV